MQEKCVCCTFNGVWFFWGAEGKKLEHAKLDSSLWSGSDRFKLAHTRTRAHVWMLAHGVRVRLLVLFLL